MFGHHLIAEEASVSQIHGWLFLCIGTTLPTEQVEQLRCRFFANMAAILLSAGSSSIGGWEGVEI